jgi:hypothetical protein
MPTCIRQDWLLTRLRRLSAALNLGGREKVAPPPKPDGGMNPRSLNLCIGHGVPCGPRLSPQGLHAACPFEATTIRVPWDPGLRSYQAEEPFGCAQPGREREGIETRCCGFLCQPPPATLVPARAYNTAPRILLNPLPACGNAAYSVSGPPGPGFLAPGWTVFCQPDPTWEGERERESRSSHRRGQLTGDLPHPRDGHDHRRP